MIQVRFVIEGTMPMLCHRATEEALTGETRKNNPTEREDPRVIAERAIYRMPNRQIAFPGSAIARMTREAGGAHKAKGSRKSLKWLVPAALAVKDDLIPLFLHDRKTKIMDFEVDSRPVTIPATKGRVMRHRARINEWAAIINLQINESIISEALMRQMINEGLEQLGLGDFRPEKGGSFGVSAMVAWDVLNAAKPLTVAQVRNSAA